MENKEKENIQFKYLLKHDDGIRHLNNNDILYNNLNERVGIVKIITEIRNCEAEKYEYIRRVKDFMFEYEKLTYKEVKHLLDYVFNYSDKPCKKLFIKKI